LIAAPAEQIANSILRRIALTSITKSSVSRGSALVLAGMLILVSGIAAMAQSVDPGANGLEGTWSAQVTVSDCQTGAALRSFPAMFAFAKGGSVTFTTAGQLPSLATPGLGVWHHVDGHQYSAVSEVFIFSPAGVWIQTHRLTRVIEVRDDANEFTDTIALEIFNSSGIKIATGCGATVATRLE
jgi:hypothetical protein